MMSDELTDDADNLDDDTALANYLGDKEPSTRDTNAMPLPDWPASNRRETDLDLDVATLNWFKQNHAEWKREMRFVLRAWIAANVSKPRTELALSTSASNH